MSSIHFNSEKNSSKKLERAKKEAKGGREVKKCLSRDLCREKLAKTSDVEAASAEKVAERSFRRSRKII